jgi:hypothetical protein
MVRDSKGRHSRRVTTLRFWILGFATRLPMSMRALQLDHASALPSLKRASRTKQDFESTEINLEALLSELLRYALMRS